MINLIIFAAESDDVPPQKRLLAIFLFVLMALIIIGMGAFVGYKAFQTKNKK